VSRVSGQSAFIVELNFVGISSVMLVVFYRRS